MRFKAEVDLRAKEAERDLIEAVQTGYTLQIERNAGENKTYLWRGLLKNGRRDGLWIGQCDGFCTSTEYADGTETGYRIRWNYPWREPLVAMSMCEGKLHGYWVNYGIKYESVREFEYGVHKRELSPSERKPIMESVRKQADRCFAEMLRILRSDPPPPTDQ